MARRTDVRRSGRGLAVYAGLVVLPLGATVAVLAAVNSGDDTIRSLTEDTHPLARLFLAITLVVAVAKLFGALAARIGQPAVVGEILAGIVLGPSVLSGLLPAAREWLIPDSTLGQLGVLAQFGVVLFVFLAGLELDLDRIRGRSHVAVLVSHVSIALPFLLGVVLAIVGHGRLAPEGLGVLPFALFLGVALSITALPVLARILLDLGMFHGTIGTLVMTCALVDDVTAWILLALVVAVAGASSLAGVLLTAVLTVAFVGVLWLLRPLLTRLVNSDKQGGATSIPLLLVGVFLAASLTDLIGVHAVLGAFLLGLALRADVAVVERLKSVIGGLSSALLLPLFFAFAGLNTDIRAFFADGWLWIWTLVILGVCVIGKFGGSALTARIMGAPWAAAGQIGALMNCRGLTGLVVLEVGRQLGVLTPALYTIMVLVTLITTAATVPLVKFFQRKENAVVQTGGTTASSWHSSA